MTREELVDRCGNILESVVFPCENAGFNAGRDLAQLLLDISANPLTEIAMEAAVAEEREACAREVETRSLVLDTAENRRILARAIRGRGKVEP